MKSQNDCGSCRLRGPSPRSTSSGGIDPPPSPAIVIYLFFGFLAFLSVVLHAHEVTEKAAETAPSVGALHIINKEYLRNVKPIFQQKCFDCHSDQTKYPWYYPILGAKQLIDYDTKEAKKHLVMTHDFPFGDAHPPQKQLELIHEAVEENEMPLWRYRFLHWGSGLTEEEKKAILGWIEFGERNLTPHGPR